MSGTNGSPAMPGDTGREQHPQTERVAGQQHPQPAAESCSGRGPDVEHHPQAAPATVTKSPLRRQTRVGPHLPCPAGPRVESDVRRPLPAANALRPLARALLAAAADLHAARRTLPGSAESTGSDTATVQGLRMDNGRVASPVVSHAVSVPVCAASVETDGRGTTNAHVSAADGPPSDDSDSMDRMQMPSPSSTRTRRRPARPAHITGQLTLDAACSLTERDRLILRLLRRHRVLSTSQIRALFFTDANTCQHRLTRLHRLHLVERFRLPIQATSEPDRVFTAGGYVRTTEYGYVLDRLGAYILAIEDDPDADWRRVRWRTDQALSIATSQRLAHTLGINQFFVDLAATACHTSDAALAQWWGETYCREVFGGMVNPDGIGAWTQDGARLLFALEYDRGTETLDRLERKLEDYRLLESALGWEFTLLVVVPGPRRETGARAKLGRHDLAVATTSQPLAGEPAAAIWAPTSANPDGHRLRLIDLAGWPRPDASRQRIALTRAQRPEGAE